MSVEAPTIEKRQESEKKVELKEVAELEEPVKKIIEKVRNRIEHGDYGLIIGDDASGRIPALILGSFIQKVSEQKGLRRPNIIFIPGKLEMESWPGKMLSSVKLNQKQSEELDEYMSSHGASKEKKILIVTDTRSSRQEIQESINQSREDADTVVKHLIDWYESR